MSLPSRFVSVCFAVFTMACLAGAVQAAPRHAAELAGNWRIVSISGKDIAGKQPLLVKLSKDGRIGGHSGCNSFGGAFKVKQSKITFSRMAATLMACPEPLMLQEQALYDAFASVARYQLQPHKLLLLDKKGRPVLVLTGR